MQYIAENVQIDQLVLLTVSPKSYFPIHKSLAPLIVVQTMLDKSEIHVLAQDSTLFMLDSSLVVWITARRQKAPITTLPTNNKGVKSIDDARYTSDHQLVVFRNRA